jgi:hypothetical protein
MLATVLTGHCFKRIAVLARAFIDKKCRIDPPCLQSPPLLLLVLCRFGLWAKACGLFLKMSMCL